MRTPTGGRRLRKWRGRGGRSRCDGRWTGEEVGKPNGERGGHHQQTSRHEQRPAPLPPSLPDVPLEPDIDAAFRASPRGRVNEVTAARAAGMRRQHPSGKAQDQKTNAACEKEFTDHFSMIETETAAVCKRQAFRSSEIAEIVDPVQVCNAPRRMRLRRRGPLHPYPSSSS